MQGFAGRTALVTGAASGIGRASALAFARAGAHVAIADRDEAGAQQTRDSIAAAGGRASVHCLDLTDEAAVDRLADEIAQRFGALDFAHNNAGFEGESALTADYGLASWNRSLAVNLTSVWLCMRAEIRIMLRQGTGAIVNTASVGGLRAVPGNAAYAAAKHGVVGLTKSAAVEYAAHNIRINAVCPGITRSGMSERMEQANPGHITRLLPPLGRIGEASETAETVLFLCSEAASFLTGQTITVDGGATAL